MRSAMPLERRPSTRGDNAARNEGRTPLAALQSALARAQVERGQPDGAAVAHKLNVASVLEGSVRRSGHTIRITAQLNNAVTGYHLWSQTYDRDLGDVLKLQTEIATAVASALKVVLLGDEAAKIEVGGTHNPAALDAYLRATKIFWAGHSPKVIESAVAGYTEAIRLDPDYALAYAARAIAFNFNASDWDTTGSAVRADLDRAQADAVKAIALAPELGEGHLARAVNYAHLLQFQQASDEFDRARSLAPGNARVMRDWGDFAVCMGHGDSGLTAVRRALAPPDIACTSLPLMRIAPEVGSSSVPAIVSSEDLPEPLGPMTATISRGATVMETSRSACTSAAPLP